MVYQFELVDQSEGEKVLEEIYYGQSIEQIKQLIWQYRDLLNKGISEM